VNSMLNHCREWYKCVLTNFDHDRQWFNTLIPPSHVSAAVTVDCISRSSALVVVGRFGDQVINSYDTIYISIGFNAFKNAFILCLCSLVMKSPHAGRAYKIRAMIRE